MKKLSLLFGILAFFAISVMSIQPATAQEKKAKAKTTLKTDKTTLKTERNTATQDKADVKVATPQTKKVDSKVSTNQATDDKPKNDTKVPTSANKKVDSKVQPDPSVKQTKPTFKTDGTKKH